jgi:hypothetical protein
MNAVRIPLSWSACALVLLAVAGCEQTVVTTVDIDHVDVSPRSATVQVNATTQLSVSVLSSSGVPLAGRTVTWSSRDPAIAEVDAAGLVRGVAPGSTQILAVSGGATGVADVSVTARPPVIVATPERLSFAAPRGADNPPTQAVDITETEGAPLAGLSAEVAYPSGQPAGWAIASLGSPSAPTVLTVRAVTGTLQPGTYTATVRIISAAASNSPQLVHLEFIVQSPLPAIALSRPDAVFATATGGGNPPAVQIGITNAGGGSVSGLSRSIAYGAGQPSGWLTATLAGSTAPTTLTLAAAAVSLPVGMYTATVRVTSATASNSPVDIPVTLTVSNAPPGTPTNLEASAASESRVNLAWSAATGAAVERYRIERRTGTSGAFVPIDSVSGGTVAYQDTGLTPSTQYTYRVQACNTAGCSSYSNTATATTGQVVPGTPPNLQANAVSVSRIDLQWLAASGTVDWYRIHRRTGTGSFITIDSVSGGMRAYQDTGLTAATQYTYRVQACNAAGCSSNSNDAVATTPALPAPPAAPGGLDATATSTSRIDVSWTHDGANTDRFEVQRSLDGGQFATIHTTSTGEARSFADSGLNEATTYHYRVRACNAVGCSAWSSVAQATTLPGEATRPDVPGDVTVTTSSATALLVSWTAPGGQTSYRIRMRSGTGGPWNTPIEVGGDATSYVQGGLQPGSTYQFQVAACNDHGCSDYSSPVTATTASATSVAVTGMMRNPVR